MENVTLCEATEVFLLDVEKVRRRTQGTVKLYSHYLEPFKKFCKGRGIKNIQEITQAFCSEFVRESFAKISAYTAKNKILFFRHFFSWVFEHYDISGKNPFKKIVVAKPKPVPRNFWTVEECEKIIAAAKNAECKCWFALMAFLVKTKPKNPISNIHYFLPPCQHFLHFFLKKPSPRHIFPKMAAQ